MYHCPKTNLVVVQTGDGYCLKDCQGYTLDYLFADTLPPPEDWLKESVMKHCIHTLRCHEEKAKDKYEQARHLRELYEDAQEKLNECFR
jgi:hypothetical protein